MSNPTLSGKRHDVDGTVANVVIGRRSYLADLQAAVGGYIEVVWPRGYDLVLVVDEEGLLKGRPLNPMGCALYGTLIHGHPIVGPVLVFDRRAFEAFDRLVGGADHG